MKINVVLLVVVLGSLVLNQAVQAQDEKTSLPKGYERVGADKQAALRKLCQATAKTGLFSGAVLVAEKGKVIYKEAFGMANREWKIPNTTDTRFRLASVSKQFCSMIVMQLVQEGKVKLDDKVTD
ncbi:MAG: serine hydrolase, partial [Gimesia sp.]|nr:serine hydrolase [Gimesia sp.]